MTSKTGKKLSTRRAGFALLEAIHHSVCWSPLTQRLSNGDGGTLGTELKRIQLAIPQIKLQSNGTAGQLANVLMLLLFCLMFDDCGYGPD